MEILAFTHAAEAHEDPSPAPELREMHLPGGVVTTLSTAAIAGAVMFGAGDAQALVGRGDTGAAVRDVQSALVSRGYNTGGIDGVFGSATERAVISFQTSQGLVPDGVVGPATASALGLSGPEFGGGGGGGGVAGTVTVSTNGGGLNGRTGPGTNFPAIAFYEDGTVLRTSGRTQNGFTELSSGIWVASQWVIGGGGGGGGGGGVGNATVTAGSGVNIRSGPGTNFAIIGGLPFGASVTVVGTVGGWSELSGGGFVASQFLSTGGGGGGGGGGGIGTVTVSTNGGTLAGRFGPGSNFGIGAEYRNGTVLNTTGRTSGGWVELTNGLWVAGDWVI